MNPIVTKDASNDNKLQNDIQDNVQIINGQDFNSIFKDGKYLITKFYEAKTQRYQKFIQKKREYKLKRFIENSKIQEKRLIEDMELEKEIQISKYEEAIAKNYINGKIKMKYYEGFFSSEILQLNESDDNDLEKADKDAGKKFRK